MKAAPIVLLAALLLAACQAPGPDAVQPAGPPAPGVQSHAATGMRFPGEVGGFVRNTFTRYDMAGLDVAAGYDLSTPEGGLAATVTIHPLEAATAGACAGAFEGAKRAVAAAHPGAKVTGEAEVRLEKGGEARPGRKVAFELHDLFAGRRQPLQSELYVFCPVGGRWVIKYRFTAPSGFAARQPIGDFLAKLPWPASVL